MKYEFQVLVCNGVANGTTQNDVTLATLCGMAKKIQHCRSFNI